MLQYDQQTPVKSWVRLALCLLTVCAGTAGAVYLGLKVHWIAAVVVAVPVWILLVGVLVSRRRSVTSYLLDFIQLILTFAGTATVASYLWDKNWIVGAVSILPAFLFLLNAIGFLMLPAYDITPETRRARKALKDLNG